MTIGKRQKTHSVTSSIKTAHVPDISDLVANNFFLDFEVQSNNWKKPPTYPPPFFMPSLSTPIFQKAEFDTP